MLHMYRLRYTKNMQGEGYTMSIEQGTIERVFTRADIVAFFHTFWGKLIEPHYELRAIALLPEIQPGGWYIDYMVTYHDSNHVIYGNCVILQLARKDGTPYLNLPEYVELPVGLASIAEEDVKIEALGPLLTLQSPKQNSKKYR